MARRLSLPLRRALLALCWCTMCSCTSVRRLRRRVDALERRLASGQSAIDRMAERLADLERYAAKEFEVLHYNVLANHSGTNMLPWFCYGANVTQRERDEMHRRFYASGPDGMKQQRGKGWPQWAVGVLSPERIAAIEAYDAAYFRWEVRRERLYQAVRSHHVGCREREPDIITLAECDCYHTFWKHRLEMGGFNSTWRKRPRNVSADGCCIAWRARTFGLIATGGYDFGSSMSRTADRTCLFALLYWRRDPTVRLLVATTHLARNPESEKQLLARGYQYGSLFRELLLFAHQHNAMDVPVVLTGDLNAKDCDELAGIARALAMLLSAPTHPLLWSVVDAPTPATTVTEDRHLRIDYVLYQSESLSLTGISNLPRLTSPIPDAVHPSDHLPVSARLVIRPHWARIEDDARQWLACVSGNTAVRPLSGDALRTAFTFFDKNGSGLVSPLQLEAGLQSLGFPGLDSHTVRAALRIAGCDSDGDRCEEEEGFSRGPVDDSRTWTMDLEQFVQVYKHFINKVSASSSIARQLDLAFAALNPNHSGAATKEQLHATLRRMATAPLDEERVDTILTELEDAREGGKITVASFSAWMARRYASSLGDPSVIPNHGGIWPMQVYNQ